MISKGKIEIARANWIKASKNLYFRIITPYYLAINGQQKEAFALLPDFGSPNGIIVCLIAPPDFKTDLEIISFAKMNNQFYSFINVDGFQKYDENYFIELLEDWTKFDQNP